MTPDKSTPLNQLVLRFLPTVNAELRRLIAAEQQIPNLHEGMLYSMGLDEASADGGKRLRPVLCLAATEALGGNVADALGFACAIELMHNFALVHDDIEDGDSSRRDRPSTYIRYGLAHGINIGDYLLCKVLSTLLNQPQLSETLRLRLLQLMSETLDHTHIGQSLDISARENRRFTREDYFQLVREKTGFYLAAPILGAAIITNASAEVRSEIQQYGHYIGPLFQITDDTLDLSTGKGRSGKIGNDLREGKRSYLVAVVGDKGTPAQIERLFDILDTPREQTTDAMIAEAQEIFESAGAIEEAQLETQRLLENGLNCTRVLPAPLEAVLHAFANGLVDRKK